MSPIICRTLRHEFRLHAQTSRLRDALRFMEIAPNLPDFTLEPVDVEVVEQGSGCAARLPDGRLIAGSTDRLLDVLHEVIFRDVEAGEPEAILLHGATVSIEGKTAFLAGRKGSGKTTLALHLVAAGHQVEGDEHLLVRPNDVVARPRTLRVKPGSLALVPKFAAEAEGAPFVRAWDGTPIRALSPAIGGQPWTIRLHQLDAVIFLTSNHGERSAAVPLPVDQAFARLVDDIVRWPGSIALGASRLRGLFYRARAYEMLLGNLTEAEWHLKRLMGS